MSTEDPFSQLEQILQHACTNAEQNVTDWQRLHKFSKDALILTKLFNQERVTTPIPDSLKSYNSTFPSISGSQLIGLATDLQNPVDCKTAGQAAYLLLSSLQSNLASYSVNIPMPRTSELLIAQSVPLEDRATQLQRRIAGFDAHFDIMMQAIKEDLLNSTNPMSLSNAAKNLRELLTGFIHHVAPTELICNWMDVELASKKPTRRSRLTYFALLTAPRGQWPPSWLPILDQSITDLLDTFELLNKFTHINKETATEIQDAPSALDGFCARFIEYFDIYDKTKEIFADIITPAATARLQELAETQIHDALSEFSSHVYEPNVERVEIKFDELHNGLLVFSGDCDIQATFQMGSDGDMKRGDGHQWEETKTVNFSGESNPLDLVEITIDLDPIELESDLEDAYEDDPDEDDPDEDGY